MKIGTSPVYGLAFRTAPVSPPLTSFAFGASAGGSAQFAEDSRRPTAPRGLFLQALETEDCGLQVSQLAAKFFQYFREIHTLAHPQVENSAFYHRLQSK